MTAILENTDALNITEPYKGTVKWFNSEKGFGVIIHKLKKPLQNTSFTTLI